MMLLAASCSHSSTSKTPVTTSETTSPVKVEPKTPVGETVDPAAENAAKTAFESIYKAVKAGDKKLMHTYFVYRGEDEGRKWNDFYNPGNREEKTMLEKEWARLEMMFTGTTGYKVKKFYTESESEGVWNILVVTFEGTGSDEESTFAMLKIKDAYAIGDID